MTRFVPFALAAALALPALAQEAVIRKNLSERLPDFPKIDEVRSTPIPGLFEVRVGMDLFYSDATGQYLLQDAHLIDLKTNRSGPFGEVALQLAAYRHAEVALIDNETVPMPPVDWCGVLWLRADGYDLYPFDAGPAQFRSFLYVQQVGRFLADQKDRDLGAKHDAITPADVAMEAAS